MWWDEKLHILEQTSTEIAKFFEKINIGVKTKEQEDKSHDTLFEYHKFIRSNLNNNVIINPYLI